MANLARLLRDDAEIVAWCSHPHLIERLEAQAVTVLRLPAWHGPLRGIRFLLAGLLLPFVLLRHRIDIVHINGHWESVLLLPCRIMGCAAISTQHQSWSVPLHHRSGAAKQRLAALFYNSNVRFASKLICVSQAVADEVKDRVPPEKLVVIPNWVNSQPPYRTPAPIHEKARILVIGRMVVFKGLALAIEALRDIPNALLTVVGEGTLFEDLRQQARGLDVHFAGFQPDVRRFYSEADIFIMPSIGFEGMPLVSLEAMSHGIPCLFSDLPVHQEISAQGTAARLFRTGDVEDLRHQMNLLIHDEEDRRRLAKAGYERIHAHYSATVTREKYVAVFQLTLDHEGALAGVVG